MFRTGICLKNRNSLEIFKNLMKVGMGFPQNEGSCLGQLWLCINGLGTSPDICLSVKNGGRL